MADAGGNDTWRNHLGYEKVEEHEHWTLIRHVELIDQRPDYYACSWQVRGAWTFTFSFDAFPASHEESKQYHVMRSEEHRDKILAGEVTSLDFTDASNTDFEWTVGNGRTAFTFMRGSGGGTLAVVVEGTGLGLALAKDLARAANWDGAVPPEGPEPLQIDDILNQMAGARRVE